MELVIATTNVHKVREYRSLLQNMLSLDIFTLHDFPHYQPLPELGSTFQENALAKAQHAAKTLQKWVLADDSGLIVPVLSGAPGIHSKHYAGETATYGDNRKKLLSAMQGFKDLERSAYYECAIVLASPQGNFKSATGLCEGIIAEDEKGSNGFGYDALFCKHDYGNKTFGELSEEIKNRISHRGKALEKLRVALETLTDNALPY